MQGLVSTRRIEEKHFLGAFGTFEGAIGTFEARSSQQAGFARVEPQSESASNLE